MSDTPPQWNQNEASEEDFFLESPLMDDDTLDLLSDPDILLSDSDDIPQTGSMSTRQPREDYSFSDIYGDLAEVQPLLDTSLPVHDINNNGSNGLILCGVFEKGESSVRQRVERHDKESGKVTEMAAGWRADKEKATVKEDEDRPKRRRTAEQHSVYERKRRSRIQEKLRTLQEMVPNASKLTESSMLDETIKHIKGLQLHLQMMKEHGVGFLSPYMQMGEVQNMQPTQYISMRPPSEMGHAHGHGTLPSACIYPPMSPAVGGWPQMSGNGVFPYYYPPQPMFPTADGSPGPPVVPAEVWAHVNPSNHHPVPPVIPTEVWPHVNPSNHPVPPVVPAEVLAHVNPSNHHPVPPGVPAQVFAQVNPPNHPAPPMVPILPQVNLANQGEAIYQNGPTMPNVQQMLTLQQMRRTAQEFSLSINISEQLGEASTLYGGNPVDYSYNLDRFDQTHPPK